MVAWPHSSADFTRSCFADKSSIVAAHVIISTSQSSLYMADLCNMEAWQCAVLMFMEAAAGCSSNKDADEDRHPVRTLRAAAEACSHGAHGVLEPSLRRSFSELRSETLLLGRPPAQGAGGPR